MKTILMDLDDTILIDSWKEFTEEYLGETIDLNSLPPNTYVNSRLISSSFADYFIDHNLYDYGVLDPKVVNFIKRLSESYNVYIASSFSVPDLPELSSLFAKRKIDYLQKHFSFLGEDKFLVVGSKNLLKADISIGDSMSDQLGTEKNFLLTRYHNKHITDEELREKSSIRVDSWDDLIEYFDKKGF